MPKIKYQDINFSADRLSLVHQCNSIINEYLADGLRLTLRQLYYQLVARDIIPNQVQQYKRLGDIVNNARLAGLIDWSAIEDRTRNLETIGHWSTPASIMESAANSFRIDKWATQKVRPEVWIEKEALAGVFERICVALDVPYFSCRGYTSQSEMWGAARRFVEYINQGKKVVVFHFGDHDPSGIDMTRDIEDRIRMFAAHHVGQHKADTMISIKRLALNMDQVEQYAPPENPAKTTDSRFRAYEEQFGTSSWELDALNPRILAALVNVNIAGVRTKNAWNQACEVEAEHRALLYTASAHWKGLTGHISYMHPDDLEEYRQRELAALRNGDEHEEEEE